LWGTNERMDASVTPVDKMGGSDSPPRVAGKQSLIAWMNYERVEMADGKSDGTEVPFRGRRRMSARRVWAVHTWVDILSLAGGSDFA
jgi:hypothetical protein